VSLSERDDEIVDMMVSMLLKGADEAVIHALRDRLSGVLKGVSIADCLLSLACVTGGIIASTPEASQEENIEAFRSLVWSFTDGRKNRLRREAMT
jgi:hypothetical protein